MWLQVTLLHASVAMAPAWLSSQAAICPPGSADPLHSTVRLDLAALLIAGAVMSRIVTVAVVELAFPQASVAVKVTSAEPVAPQRSLSPV